MSTVYDPLPLSTDDLPSTSLYNAPSPDPPPDATLPPGAAPPRFLGHRDSFASSNNTIHSPATASEYTSSVYALNDSSNPARLNPGFDSAYRDEPNDTFLAGDSGAMPMSSVGQSRLLDEKRAAYAPPRAKARRRALLVAALIIALLILIAAVVVPVYFAIIKPKNASSNQNSSAGGGSSGTTPGSTPLKSAVITGGDGSTVTMEDGTTFTYNNKFGGYWYWDENDPFNNGARPQAWTPALNETFNYGIDKIRGVNIGGWLNTEPFITPALFEPYAATNNPAIDEWTLSINMAQNGGIQQLENHYKTFITEQDFAEIAAAGLNFVRIPLPYWAIEVRDGEPFYPKVAWTYFLKGIKWARKYGLRINLDLHAVPGSQNGWNHSGRFGVIGFLNGPMGYANAQRTLDYIRIIAEFISQPQYRDVVTIFGIVNEPAGKTMGQGPLESFYVEAYNIIRKASGVGTGMGPYIAFHDGFGARSDWYNFIPNGDRLAIDSHPYICFGDQSDAPIETLVQAPCLNWAQQVNASMGGFGLTTAGEFSNAINDCGLYLNGVNIGTRYEGTYPGVNLRIGDCGPWMDWENWNADLKTGVKQFTMASMDALQNYFFWTWKIANSSATGKVMSPAWSYKLGVDNGWIPKDPREADGACGNTNPWQPPLKSWQTGGAGAGNVPPGSTDNFPWPPPNIANGGPVNQLPAYVPNGAVPTLPPPTFTAASSKQTINAGTGWNNPQDQAGLYVPKPGCTYLDPWVAPNVAAPVPLCPGA